MNSFQLQADMYNSITPSEIEARDLKERVKELESIKVADPRRAFTGAVCGTCKYADVPRNRKPCCSCYWLERENYYEEADDE